MSNKPTPKQLITRAIWLAFQASSPAGYGFLHVGTANQLKESDMEDLLEEKDGSFTAYTDYVAGRMMKTDFNVNKAGVLVITPEAPRRDYQSWSRQYSTASDLLADVLKSF